MISEIVRLFGESVSRCDIKRFSPRPNILPQQRTHLWSRRRRNLNKETASCRALSSGCAVRPIGELASNVLAAGRTRTIRLRLAVCLSYSERGLSYARDASQLSETEIPARRASAVQHCLRANSLLVPEIGLLMRGSRIIWLRFSSICLHPGLEKNESYA